MERGLSSSFFWPNEVPKNPSQGFLDVLNPLAQFSKEFEEFFCRFFTIEVTKSSRELRAPIDGGHAQMSPSLFSVTKQSSLTNCYDLNTLGQVSEAVEDFYMCFFPKRSSGKLMATCRRGHARMSHDPFSEFYQSFLGFLCVLISMVQFVFPLEFIISL